jgi:hypothetical protein
VSSLKPSRRKHVPKHRQARHRAETHRAPGTVVRRAAALSTVAVAATGVAVAGGVKSPELVPSSSQLGASVAEPMTDAELEDRAAATVSRSDSRADTDETKAAALAQDQGGAVARTEDLSGADPRDIAMALLPEFGFSPDEFSCLDSLYVSESNWRVDADNPTSSAYGIPQALTSMHDLPANYDTSAEAQIRWGLGYIQDAYGTPCSAWSFKQSNGWY